MGFAGGILLLALMTGGAIYEFRNTVPEAGGPLPEVDVIVCLAGARGRIRAASDLWYRYWNERGGPLAGEESLPARRLPVLYIAGMGHRAGWNVFEGRLRDEVAQSLEPKHVVLETESSNTEENARWLAHYIRDRGWKSILLITSSYHMRRAHHIFDRVLNKQMDPGDVRIETLAVAQEPFVEGKWHLDLYAVRVTLAEYLKWVYYRTIW